MSERSLRFCSWWTRDRVSRYDIIVCVCTLTSGRVGCGCTVRSFTTHGEWGLSCLLDYVQRKLIVESGNVRGSKCKSKSYVIEMKTHGQVIAQT